MKLYYNSLDIYLGHLTTFSGRKLSRLFGYVSFMMKCPFFNEKWRNCKPFEKDLQKEVCGREKKNCWIIHVESSKLGRRYTMWMHFKHYITAFPNYMLYFNAHRKLRHGYFLFNSKEERSWRKLHNACYICGRWDQWVLKGVAFFSHDKLHLISNILLKKLHFKAKSSHGGHALFQTTVKSPGGKYWDTSDRFLFYLTKKDSCFGLMTFFLKNWSIFLCGKKQHKIPLSPP